MKKSMMIPMMLTTGVFFLRAKSGQQRFLSPLCQYPHCSVSLVIIFPLGKYGWPQAIARDITFMKR